MSNKTLGYVNLWRIPDINITYEKLAELATEAGFDGKIPTPPNKRGAWERATNLGAGGIKVSLPAEKLEEIKRRYNDVQPSVRLETKVISDKAPLLTRHIVRTVTIPVNDETDKRKLAMKQLSSETVCIMQFDCTTKIMASTGYHELRDTQGWVNGNLEDVVREIEDNVDKALFKADGMMVANCVRDYLINLGATLMSSAGAAYFIPYSGGLLEKLRSLKTFVELLADYRVKENDRVPQIAIFPLTEDGDLLDARLDIAENAVAQFEKQLASIAEELAPVVGGERTENVTKNVRKRATEKYNGLTAVIAQYRLVLNDNLSQLDNVLSHAQEAIDRANGVSVFRTGRRGLSTTEDQEQSALSRAKRGLEAPEQPEEVPAPLKRQRRLA